MVNANHFSKVLAASAYTKGLWQPILLHLRLKRPLFYGSSGDWGLDRGFIRRHAFRAALLAMCWFGVFLVLFVTLAATHRHFLAIIGAWLVLVQWHVYPWFMIRKLLVGAENHDANNTVPKIKSIVTPGSDFSIPDLGVLVREAQFGIDMTQFTTSDSADQTETCINAEDILKDIMNRLSESGQGLNAQLVSVQSSRVIQRGAPVAEALRSTSLGMGGERLFVLGTARSDGAMNVAEVSAWNVGRHVSLLIRLLWLPPIRGSLDRLNYIANEKFWWRALFLPAMLLGLTLLMVFIAGLILQWLADVAEVPIVINDLAFMIDNDFGAASVVFAAAVTISIILPVIYIGLRYLERLLHNLQGFVYSLAGRYFAIRFFRSLRYVATTSSISDEEALHEGVAAVQVMETVIRNAAVAAFERVGIDAGQLKEQFNVFINEGLYVTGGSVRAEQLAVGRKSRAVKWKKRGNLRGGGRMQH